MSASSVREGFGKPAPLNGAHKAIGRGGEESVSLKKSKSSGRATDASTTSIASADTDAVRLLRKRIFNVEPEFQKVAYRNAEGRGGLKDHIFSDTENPPSPESVFDELRWGGRFIYVAKNPAQLSTVMQRFSRYEGFVMDSRGSSITDYPLGIPIPFLGKKLHYFVARKVLLIKPGESSERFTYHVQLAKLNPNDTEYVVRKQVPSVDRVVSRLQQKFPDTDLDEIRRRAHKFTDRIFPVFLTRETAMLKILQRDLPPEYRDRVPRVLREERDSRGFVNTMYMTWLRNGGPTRSQVEFARQSTELLQVMHDKIGVIHLDLRLDNFVITEKGVGFIDFGSAVRVGETFTDNSLLSTLFEEMMRTSQIQRMLGHMTEQGLVTSKILRDGYHKVDKAVDIFYLTVQMNRPHSNPDFKGLVAWEAGSLEAKLIKRLTDEVLRPVDGGNTPYKSVGDILRGLQRIEMVLSSGENPTEGIATDISDRPEPECKLLPA